MRIRLSEFKKIINKFLEEALEEMSLETEDTDRLRRAKDGYGDSDFDESVDRLNRAKDGYGDSTFDEAGPPPAAPQSIRPRIKDKSQMQGVGPRPTMATAFGNDQQQQQQPKKEVSLGEEEQDPNLTPPLSPESPNAQARAQNKASKQQAIKQISHQQQAQMQQQGWKFDRQPDGNWSAMPPKNGGMQKHESKKSKKR